MNIRNFSIHLAAMAVAVVISGSSPAYAQDEGTPIRECIHECVGIQRDCFQGCRALVADCMNGPRLEMRLCRADCTSQFEAESPELAACMTDCRETILAPALEECRPLGRECAQQCLPGSCLRICRPEGPGIGEPDECRAGCALGLRQCARGGRAALYECLSPCRELTDPAEILACRESCVETAKANAHECREGFAGCTATCEEPSETTTLP